MVERTEKSYNPFKMWGSWVGLILGLILPMPLSPMSLVPPIFMIIGFILTLLGTGFPSQITNPFLFTLAICSPPILGFLLGWLIHSLIRRFKK